METTPQKSHWIGRLFRAVQRARYAILSVAAAYIISIAAGMIMVHTGNSFAINYRDQLVGQAVQNDQITQAAIQGNNVEAAFRDFAGNLALGAIPKTLSGFGVIFPYTWVAYQGWVGGIVSVRGDHTSRLDDPRSAVYYLLTLLLQVIPYSLAVGAGVNVGISMFKPIPDYQGSKWLSLFPKEALLDVVRLYALAAPLFLNASLWEFLSTWNI